MKVYINGFHPGPLIVMFKSAWNAERGTCIITKDIDIGKFFTNDFGHFIY